MKHHYFWTLSLLILFIELYSLFPTQDLETIPNADKGYLSGIIHVHSNLSDGSGTPEEIALDAHAAGHDFVVLTDHNNQNARKQGLEKSYQNTDLFVEMEAATTVGHTLSFFSLSQAQNLDDESIIQLSYKHFLGTETRPNFFIALAHPSNIKNPWNRLDKYGDGFEVINFDSVWQRQFSDSILNFALTVLIYPFNNYLSALRFFTVYPKDFTAWDEMNSRGPGHFGILAHDTHAKLKLNNEHFLPWPSYLQTFKLASNIVFLNSPKATDFAGRKQQIYSALKAGRNAFVFHALHPYPGNSFNLKCQDKLYLSGDILDLPKDSAECRIQVEVPKTKFQKIVRLIKDGKLETEMIVEPEGQKQEFPLLEKGIYRVEVWGKMHTTLHLLLNRRVPYVFYNPIYVK